VIDRRQSRSVLLVAQWMIVSSISVIFSRRRRGLRCGLNADFPADSPHNSVQVQTGMYLGPIDDHPLLYRTITEVTRFCRRRSEIPRRKGFPEADHNRSLKHVLTPCPIGAAMLYHYEHLQSIGPGPGLRRKARSSQERIPLFEEFPNARNT
jgi:hypothetical protein